MESAQQTVLVAVDVSTDPQELLGRLRALGLAGHARFVVLGVVPRMSSVAAEQLARSGPAHEVERELVEAVKESAATIATELGAGDAQIVSGKLVDEVVQAVAVHRPQLVVRLSGVAPEESPPIFGGAEKQLARKCSVPVLLLNPASPAVCRHMAVAIDRHDVGSDLEIRRQLSELIMQVAVQRAEEAGLRQLDVIHAWEPFGSDVVRSPRSGLSPEKVREYVHQCEAESRAWLEGFVADAAARFSGSGLTFEPRLVQGHARRVVAEECRRRDIDLLVLGTVARRGVLGFLIGNTAEELLDRIGCSVLAVRPEAEL